MNVSMKHEILGYADMETDLGSEGDSKCLFLS